MPYVYYATFIWTHLHPTEHPDTFAYLWRPGFNFYFLTGRSLTQRFIFMLVRYNAEAIVFIQLSGYALTAVIIHTIFTVGKSNWFKGLLAIFITAIFSSYTFNLTAIMLNAEPIFICLLLLTPCLFFGYQGKYRHWIILSCGILFLLSKNVAPFILITLMGLRLITQKISYKPERMIYLTLLIISLGRIISTHLYDTSLHINTLNNLYRRVLISPQITAHFQQKYQLPHGTFVAQCQNQWVDVPCLGKKVLSINENSRNYELATDDYGVVEWVKTGGQQAYLRYLLWDNPQATYQKYKDSFHFYANTETITTLIQYLALEIPPRDSFYAYSKKDATINYLLTSLGLKIPPNELNNQAILVNLNQAEGFWHVDPLTVIYNVLLILGFNHLEFIIAYILIGFVLLQKVKFVSQLSLAITCLISALLLFFLTFFGDALEIARHVFPAYLMLILGGVLYVGSGIEIGLHYGRRLKL